MTHETVLANQNRHLQLAGVRPPVSSQILGSMDLVIKPTQTNGLSEHVSGAEETQAIKCKIRCLLAVTEDWAAPHLSA